MSDSTGYRYDDLGALFLNCTLKRSPRSATPRGSSTAVVP